MRWREQWADHSNYALEQAGIDARIDHRSLEAQGITDRLPTIHEGPIVREMESRGAATDRGAINRAAKEHNAAVVSLDTYRKEKENIQRSKELLHPEERKTLRRATEILRKPVALKSVREGMQDLKEREQGLQFQEEKLRKQQQPFNEAETHFQNIKKWSAELEGSSVLSRAFDRESKYKYIQIKKRILEARTMLSALGFQNEPQFQARKEKVFSYIGQEQAGIAETRQETAAAMPVLKAAEKVLQKQEIRSIAEQYRNVPGIKTLQYKEAEAIETLNQAAGRTLTVTEIRTAHKQQAAEFLQLEQQLEQIRKNAERLHGGGQWLDKNEAQSAQAQKLFQPAKVKVQLQNDLQISKRMLKEFGVTDRKDYNRQLGDQQRAEEGKGGMEGQMTRLQLGLNLLQGAVRALNSVGQRQQADEHRQQWAKQHKGYIKSKDQEWER